LSAEQIAVFAVLGAALVLFVWDRIRYDVVALLALLAVVGLGLVPPEDAFLGFADPVVVTVAAVMVLSAAMRSAGLVDQVLRLIDPLVRRRALQVVTLVAVVTVFSAFMNNVGALAIVMPVALQVARRHRRPPSELLMPIAFGSLLGGLITLIGTPPNLLISSVRQRMLGAGFEMFDFAPVGLGLALAGTAYLAFAWRLLPRDRRGETPPEMLFSIEDYLAEVRLPETSPFVDRTVADLEALASGDLTVTAIIRENFRRHVPAAHWRLLAGDILAVEADPAVLRAVVAEAGLELVGSKELSPGEPLDDVAIVEAVVAAGSPMIGCSPAEMRLRQSWGVNLLAVGRRGRPTSVRLRRVKFQLGDVLVLQGSESAMPETLQRLGCLPLAGRNLQLGQPRRAALSGLTMAVAILLAVFDIVPVAIAFTGAIVVVMLSGILSLRQVYDAVPWPILVLLGSMIPVTSALEATGGTTLLAGWLATLAAPLPPVGALALVMVASMAVTPFLNNAAAVLVMAPVAIGLAGQLGLSPDPFLMAVAVGTSCDFLTPIGHQSNTLVMGPGGYRFADYWRLGLPLSLLVVAAGVPLIAVVWPF